MEEEGSGEEDKRSPHYTEVQWRGGEGRVERGKGVERRGGAVNRWEGAARLCVCGPKGLCVEATGDSVV